MCTSLRFKRVKVREDIGREDGRGCFKWVNTSPRRSCQTLLGHWNDGDDPALLFLRLPSSSTDRASKRRFIGGMWMALTVHVCCVSVMVRLLQFLWDSVKLAVVVYVFYEVWLGDTIEIGGKVKIGGGIIWRYGCELQTITRGLSILYLLLLLKPLETWVLIQKIDWS